MEKKLKTPLSDLTYPDKISCHISERTVLPRLFEYMSNENISPEKLNQVLLNAAQLSGIDETISILSSIGVAPQDCAGIKRMLNSRISQRQKT